MFIGILYVCALVAGQDIAYTPAQTDAPAFAQQCDDPYQVKVPGGPFKNPQDCQEAAENADLPDGLVVVGFNCRQTGEPEDNETPQNSPDQGDAPLFKKFQ